MSAPLAVLPGDPRGIGPEVMVRALVMQRVRRAVLVGDAEALTGAVARFAPGWSWPIVDAPGDEPPEVRAIRWSVDAALAGRVRAVVTGPIHKARLAARGFGYPGHTEFLGALCGVERPVMAFVGGSLRVALVTVHLPLARVPSAVTTDAVLHTVRVAARALTDQLGMRAPRLVVCGLNPHAGDGGLLGHEDLEVVAPAVAAARALGIGATGPISAEGAFLAARRGAADLVVAMYHDQGLAPLKAVDFGKSVNWTLGLPFVRTSVDHGTADDLVGTGRADPSSARAAVRLALLLTRQGQAGAPSIAAHQSASAPSVQQSDTPPSRS